MNDEQSGFYTRGQQQELNAMLHHVLARLGYKGEPDQRAWLAEREDAVIALRCLCKECGDDNWNNQDHLADVIEKHLANHLLSPQAPVLSLTRYEVERKLALLRRIEWCVPYEGRHVRSTHECPACGALQSFGVHAQDCELEAEILNLKAALT